MISHRWLWTEILMQLTLDDEKTKALLTEVLIEMLQQKREVFYDIVLDALEEVGIANAIIEGEETEFVYESAIRDILQGESWTSGSEPALRRTWSVLKIRNFLSRLMMLKNFFLDSSIGKKSIDFSRDSEMICLTSQSGAQEINLFSPDSGDANR